MEDLNKISSTRVGDNIHFYINGAEDKGVVVKMDTGYVTVLKDDGNFQDIHINDTFFIKDILVNKTWNDMNMEERTIVLHKIKAYSPRFLAKSWQELPRELKTVLENSNKDALDPKAKPQEDLLGNPNTALPKNTRVGQKPPKVHDAGDYEEDYGTGEQFGNPYHGSTTRITAQGIKNQNKPQYQSTDPGAKYYKNPSHPGRHRDTDPDTNNKNPNPRKKSNVEQGHLGTAAGNPESGVETNQTNDATDDYEGQTEDEKKEQFRHEAKKPQTTNKTLQEQLWEDWLNKESSGNMGDGGNPAQTSMTTGTTGVYNAVYGKDGRIKGQEKDKDDEDTEKDKEDKEKERKG